MSLQELAWLGGTMSGIGVLFTILYASIQIRNNTRAVRAAAFQQVVNSFAAISFDIARDRQLSEIYIAGSRDFAALSELDRARFSLMLLSFLRRAENVFFQSELRMLHTRQWSGIRDSIAAIVTPPGAQACWRDIRNRLNPDFRRFVDDLIAQSESGQP